MKSSEVSNIKHHIVIVMRSGWDLLKSLNFNLPIVTFSSYMTGAERDSVLSALSGAHYVA